MIERRKKLEGALENHLARVARNGAILRATGYGTTEPWAWPFGGDFDVHVNGNQIEIEVDRTGRTAVFSRAEALQVAVTLIIAAREATP